MSDTDHRHSNLQSEYGLPPCRRIINHSDWWLHQPKGLTTRRVAAHWTPNSGDKVVLQYDDVMKLDFRTQIDGHKVYCAFTVAFNPIFDPLLEASREATNMVSILVQTRRTTIPG